MIDEQKIDEYRELLVQTGVKQKTVYRYIEEIKGFMFIYGDDLENLNDENIKEYAESTYSETTRRIRLRVVGMFKEWIFYGTKPKRAKHWKADESKLVPKEEKPDQRLYWDNMYNRPAFYKDSHSAQWC